MHQHVLKAVGGCLLGVLVACGGGGGGGTGGTTGGGGLGPSGQACTTAAACASVPAGTTGLNCPANVGAAQALQPTDGDLVLNRLNTIRTGLGLPIFTRTAALDTFALAASTDLRNGGGPHAYFIANAGTDPAFTGGRAENQTAPSWFTNATATQITEIINCFMAEETAPAGTIKGHWENIVCPCFSKIGIGLLKDAAGNLFLTIDFSQ